MDLRRLFRTSSGDAAASPVIGVILMVGTTVVLGASVYAWSSAYANVPEQGIRVIGLLPQGHEGDLRTYLVAAVMPGLRYADIVFSVDGEVLLYVEGEACAPPEAGQVVACEQSRPLHARDLVQAGDMIRFHAPSGAVLQVVDSAAGVVVLSQTVV